MSYHQALLTLSTMMHRGLEDPERRGQSESGTRANLRTACSVRSHMIRGNDSTPWRFWLRLSTISKTPTPRGSRSLPGLSTLAGLSVYGEFLPFYRSALKGTPDLGRKLKRLQFSGRGTFQNPPPKTPLFMGWSAFFSAQTFPILNSFLCT